MNTKVWQLTTEGVDYRQGTLYSVGREMNVLFSMELSTGKTKVMLQMPDEDKFEQRLYNGVSIDKDILVLIPYNAKKLWFYNFRDLKWDFVDISSQVSPNMNGKFVGGKLINGKAYLFGYTYKGILVVDIKTKRIKLLFKEMDQNKYVFWGQNTVMIGGKLYVISMVTNEMICIDTNSDEYEIIKVKDLDDCENNSNGGIIFENEKFYIVKHHGNIVYEFKNSNDVCTISLDSFFDTNVPYFNGMAACGNQFLFYSPKGKSYVYDKKQPLNSKVIEEKMFFAKYIADVGLVVCKKGKVSVYDNLFQEIQNFDTEINADERQMYMQNVALPCRILNESEYININDLISKLIIQEG